MVGYFPVTSSTWENPSLGFVADDEMDVCSEFEPAGKRRKINWTGSEIECLIQEVEGRNCFLFSAFSNVVTNKRKGAAWAEIANKVSACSNCPRSAGDVKKKWITLKSETKKKAATFKKISSQTGGGTAPPILTEMEEKIVSLIPTCQVDGCEGGLESEFNPCAVASTGAEDLEITGIEAATGSEIETEQEVVVVQDVSPQAGICEKSTRCKKPAATGDAESNAARLLAIEEQKLVLMREHLAVDRERLEVEKSILFELKHISGSTTTCLSPLIKINYP